MIRVETNYIGAVDKIAVSTLERCHVTGSNNHCCRTYAELCSRRRVESDHKLSPKRQGLSVVTGRNLIAQIVGL